VKLISYAEATWLVGDEATDVLMEYAVLLGRTGSADAVTISALDANGSRHDVSFLIGPATMMTAGSADSESPEPDNGEAIALIKERMRQLRTDPIAIPVEAQTEVSYPLEVPIE
jgi:hypothetical protein